MGSRPGRVDVHDLLGRLPDLGSLEPRSTAALPGRRHRCRLGELGLDVRPRALQLRVGRVAGTARRPTRALGRRFRTDLVGRGDGRCQAAHRGVDVDRSAGWGPHHERGRPRVGSTRRRARGRVPRRAARRRAAGRGARSAAGDGRRRCQRGHGDPARTRHQGRAAGAVPAPARRGGAGTHTDHRVLPGRHRHDAVCLAQRSLPSRRRLGRDPARARRQRRRHPARVRRRRRRGRPGQPRRVPSGRDGVAAGRARRRAQRTSAAGAPPRQRRRCAATRAGADRRRPRCHRHPAGRRRRQARPARAARRRSDQRLPRRHARPTGAGRSTPRPVDRHLPLRLDQAGRPGPCRRRVRRAGRNDDQLRRCVSRRSRRQ